jgi:hypothetical protein
MVAKRNWWIGLHSLLQWLESDPEIISVSITHRKIDDFNSWQDKIVLTESLIPGSYSGQLKRECDQNQRFFFATK